MYPKPQIIAIFGENILKYLECKNRGGRNNEKGNNYENYFAIYKLAQFSQQVIEKQIEIKFYSQRLAFVDDLIIDYFDTRIHHQLKNKTSNISWGNLTESGSISNDFYRQTELNERASVKTTQLYLVVQSKQQEKKLSNKIPGEIINCTKVIHFPDASTITELIKQVSDFKEAIDYLCAFEKPEPDKVECVATVLLGAWHSIDKSEVSVMSVLEKAQKTNPSYIRSFNLNVEINKDLGKILEQIPDFSYSVSKGFFHWQYAQGLESGTLPYSIETQDFDKFQKLVIEKKPSSFDDLEVFLI